jgi:phospholipase A-2-activating protein
MLTGHSQAVWALLPLRGQKVLSASGDRSIKLWDTHDGKCLGTLTGHGDCVRALALLPDGSFVSAGNDCMIKVTNSRTHCLEPQPSLP